MKKIAVLMLFYALIITLKGATLSVNATELRSYKVGENVTFKVTAKNDDGTLLKDGKFTITVRDSGTAGAVVGTPLEIDLAKENPVSFTAKLDRPGFVFVFPSSYRTSDGKYHRWNSVRGVPYTGGAAVEPEKIRQGGVVPEDFDKFWQDGIAQYKDAKITVTPDAETKREGYKVFRVKVFFPDNSGSINGFLSIPEGNGKFPALVAVPGAGPGTVNPAVYVKSNKKAIELYMNVHPYETCRTFDEMQKLYNEMNSKYSTKGYHREFAWDRDKYIYRKVWLALGRAVDYVAQLPEYDGKHFAAAGHSQGGGTALAMGYLNKNITCIAASVPALCDHGGYLENRQAGWPQLHVTLQGRADKVMPYFDCATFAAKLKIPAFITVGYVDTTCSPSSVYAAFNNITSPKVIYPMYDKGHSGSPQSFRAASAFLDKEFSK